MSNIAISNIPTSDILFDRIINVELLWTERNEQIAYVGVGSKKVKSTDVIKNSTTTVNEVNANGTVAVFADAGVVSALVQRGAFKEKRKRHTLKRDYPGGANTVYDYTFDDAEEKEFIKSSYTNTPVTYTVYNGFEHTEYAEDNLGNITAHTVKANSGRTFYFNMADYDNYTINYKEGDKTITGKVTIEYLLKMGGALNMERPDPSYDDYYSKQTWKRFWASKITGNKSVTSMNDDLLGKDVTTYADGDKIVIDDHGTKHKYHIVWGSASDEVYTKDYYVRDHTYINCNDSGIKPLIAFSTNLIPGANCYKLTLKLTNMNIGMDIRQVNRVRVTAGYRTQGFTNTFDCPVFSSYIESPNPDGVTVFNCLCVGRTGIFMDTKPVTVKYLGGSITIEHLFAQVCMGLGVKGDNRLSDKYNNLSINMSKMDAFSENGQATVEWMRNIIQKRIALAENAPTDHQDLYKYEQPYIMVSFTENGDLVLYALNRPNKDTLDSSSIINIVSLDAVTGATFNGVALTVKSIWNPHLHPGDVFKMQPNIINGANLPNSLAPAAYGNTLETDYLYRCITMSIAFSTNGSENEMSIMAVPIKYVENITMGSASSKTLEEFAAVVYANYDTSGGKTITLGTAEDSSSTTNTDEKKQENIITAAQSNLFNMDILSLFPTTTDYTIVEGDSLSKIAERFFATSGHEGKKYCPFELVVTKETATAGQGTGIMGKENLWPIIAVLTYRRRLASGNNMSKNPYEHMNNMDNPNRIIPGHVLVIPVIDNIEKLQQIREMFKYAWTRWKDITNYNSYTIFWKNIYTILGGTI